MAEDEEPELSTPLTRISNTQLDQLIDKLGRHPLAEGEVREIEGMTGVYVSLSKSQPETFEYAFCLSADGRLYHFFRKAAEHST
jgi:hypothetical protein